MQESGRIAENTLTAELADKLKQMGLKAAFELQFTTPTGIKKPDISIEFEGRSYFIEAKQRPQKLNDAVSKAYVYKQSLAAVTQVRSVFAIVYPREGEGEYEAAVLLNESPFYSYCERKPKNLDELALWIFDIIKQPPTTDGVNTGHVINLLNNSIEDLTESFQKLNVSEIDGIFGGKDFFESVLGFSEENKITIQYLRRGAAYLLVNQLLFYQILARETKRFEVLEGDMINHPAELDLKYFAKVLEIDYKPIFDFSIASKLSDEKATYDIRKTVNAINALVPERHGHDILGKIFHNLIPLNIRKVVAAYYTNSEAAELLASVAVDKADAEIMDPACGSGTLLVAAYRRKKALHQSSGSPFNEDTHKQFVENDITGIDIMPFAAHLAAVHLSLQSPLYNTDKVRISIGDSTKIYPHFTIAPAHDSIKEAFKHKRITDFFESSPKDERVKRSTKAGVVKLAEEETPSLLLDYCDAVIMNPPFTRRENLVESYRKHLVSQFKDYRKYIFGKLGLHSFFIFRADSFLREGGRMAMVLPASILRVQTTEGIRRFIIDNYDVNYIITTEQRSAFSENALFREILLITTKVKNLNKGKPQPNADCAIVVLKKLPSDLSSASRIGEAIKHESQNLKPGSTIELESMTIAKVSRSQLVDNVSNLFKFIAMSDPRVIMTMESIKSRSRGKLKKFKECYSDKDKIGLGIEMNSSAIPVNLAYILRNPGGKLKSVDKWVVEAVKDKSIIAKDRFSQITVSAPRKSLRYGLRRTSGLAKMNVQEDLDFVIADKFNGLESIFGGQFKNLENKIEKWNKQLSADSCNLVFARRFDISATGTRHLAFFSNSNFTPTRMMWAIKSLTDYDSKILALWFNSTLYIADLLINRIETRGAFLDVSKYLIEDSYILDISSLSEHQKYLLMETFEKVSEMEFPPIIEQFEKAFEGRKIMDYSIMRVLGFGEKETKDALPRMYSAIGKEIRLLKDMMEQD